MKARPFQLLGFDVLIDKVRKGRCRVDRSILFSPTPTRPIPPHFLPLI